MSHDATLQAWIHEALTAAGGSGSPLGVARHVWSQHRAAIEAAGDLVLTWQVDLRATADAMVGAGSLTVADSSGTWSLRGAGVTRSSRPGWSEEHVEAVVEAYVSMLRDAHAGRPVRRAEAVSRAAASTGRAPETLDGLFANVSAVVQELGLEHLPSYPPRSNVPVGVRPAVRAALADVLDD